MLVVVAGFFLLVTGRYPRGLFDLLVGIGRWCYRVLTYVALMHDEYPPFRLDQGQYEPHNVKADRPPLHQCSSARGPEYVFRRSLRHADHDRSPTMEQTQGPMAGKTVLVTGGSGGIGRATTLGLAVMGAPVAITGRDRGRAEDAAQKIRAAGGGQVDVFVADLSCQSELRRLAQKALRSLV
ncbi:MAG TPA: SDR family NAD(P)-dependent oxidoreductase, partial [Propionibacteriaceae bacterium]